MYACVFAYFAYLRSTYHIKCPPIHKNDFIRHTKRDEATCALTTPTMLTHRDSTQGEGRTDTIYTIIHISMYVCVCVHFSAHFTVATFSSFLFVVSILPSTCMRTICRGLLLPSQGLPAFLSPRIVMRRLSVIVPCIRVCTSTHQGTDDFGMSPG